MDCKVTAEDLGFDMSYSKESRGKSRHGNRGSYVLRCNNAGRHRVCLIIAEDDRNKVMNIVGDRCDFGIDKRGAIILTKGDGRKVSSVNDRTRKMTVSIGSAQDALLDIFGEFRRVYMDCSVAGFLDGAVVFTPTGERD